MISSTTHSKPKAPPQRSQATPQSQSKALPARRKRPGRNDSGHGNKRGRFGSMMGSGQPQEIASSSENVLNEDFRSGTTATQALLNHTAIDTSSFVSNSTVERDSFRKKAPELFENFKSALLNYKAADSQAVQSMARGDIEVILDGAPTNLEASVASLRNKVLALFKRADRRWAARQAARDLVLPSVQELRKIAQEYGISNPKQLRNYLSASLYYRPNNELLSSQAGGRSVAQTLFQKGALG